MTALTVDTLAAVRAAGGEVKLVSPYRLKLIAPTALPSDLVEQVRAVKPDLLNLLQNKDDVKRNAQRLSNLTAVRDGRGLRRLRGLTRLIHPARCHSLAGSNL